MRGVCLSSDDMHKQPGATMRKARTTIPSFGLGETLAARPMLPTGINRCDDCVIVNFPVVSLTNEGIELES